MESIRVNTTAIDSDLLNDLANTIGRIALDAFNSPEVRKQFEEWKQRREVEAYDNGRQESARYRSKGRDW